MALRKTNNEKRKTLVSYSIFMLIFLLLTLAVLAQAATKYVKWNAAGTNDGSSWTNAWTSLRNGANSATTGDEVWVAGTNTYAENVTMKGGVAIYGGFAGTETLRSERAIATNKVTVDPNAVDGIVGAAGCTIDGFYVTGAVDGIDNNTATVTIANNIIYSCTSEGIE